MTCFPLAIRCGADADELIRLLRLTGPQALWISTALSGTGHPD